MTPFSNRVPVSTYIFLYYNSAVHFDNDYVNVVIRCNTEILRVCIIDLTVLLICITFRTMMRFYRNFLNCENVKNVHQTHVCFWTNSVFLLFICFVWSDTQFWYENGDGNFRNHFYQMILREKHHFSLFRFPEHNFGHKLHFKTSGETHSKSKYRLFQL